jgi:Susd and RagB outer membrane lipoprotein
MTRTNKLLVAIAASATMALGSCTKDFKSINTNPDGVYPNQVAVDYKNLSVPLNQAQLNVFSYVDYVYQLQQNLNADVFSGYMMSPDDGFNSGKNNETYYLDIPGWNQTPWDQAYNNVMAPIATVLQATAGIPNDAPFYAWAKLIRVEAMHRVTDIFGPIIYSHYGQSNPDGSTSYDAQQAVYTQFFSELDSSINTFEAAMAASPGTPAPFQSVDLIYNGKYVEWVKFANTLRLRLAIRVSNVDPTLAQTEGEKSLADVNGLLSAASDDAYVNIGVNPNPITLIANSYQDINMGAPLVSMMNGYKDPRLSQYAQPATAPAVAGQYIGIRQGIAVPTYAYFGYSLPVNFPNTILWMTAAEAWFLKAEAALRGWAGAGDAGTDYNSGIATSFSQYGGLSATTYMNDATSTAQPYTDPLEATPGQNDVPAGTSYLSTITIKWNDADPFQTKLERIITQKWIAMYPDGEEAWAEFRRTLYPKLWPVIFNYSNGTISTTKFIRRLKFASDEYSDNSAGVTAAIGLLGNGQQDTGGVPLWWDTNPQ